MHEVLLRALNQCYNEIILVFANNSNGWNKFCYRSQNGGSAASAVAPSISAVPANGPLDVSEVPQISLTNNKGGPWPFVYVLPKFTHNVEVALSNEKNLIYLDDRCNSNRTSLVQTLFEDMLTYETGW